MVYNTGFISLTRNEARLVSFLLRNFGVRYSINALARELKLSPRGAYKIVKKLENAAILKSEAIGNSLYYHPNLDNETGKKVAELALSYAELNPYAKVQAKDLERLKPYVLCAVLFGSVLDKAEKAGDIDILFVLGKSQFKSVHKILLDIQNTKPKKIGEMLQSKEDLVKNIRNGDAPLLSALKNGQILWGSEIIVEAIKNGTRRE